MKNNFLKQLIVYTSILAGMALVLTACLPDPPEATLLGYVNIYNAYPDANGSLDVYLNGTQINKNQNQTSGTPFEYSKNSSYLNFNTGVNNLKFNQYNTQTKLLERDLSIETDGVYSLFLIKGDSGLAARFVRDKSDQATTTTSRIRFAQLSPDAPALDLVFKDSASLFVNSSYKSISEFFSFKSGTYSFQLKTSADGTALNTDEIKFTLEAGKYYTIIAQGYTSSVTGNNNKITLKLIPN